MFSRSKLVGKNGKADILINFRSKPFDQRPGNLLAFDGMRGDGDVFLKQFIIIYISGYQPDIFMAVFTCPGIVYARKDAFNAVFTDKSIHRTLLNKKCMCSGNQQGITLIRIYPKVGKIVGVKQRQLFIAAVSDFRWNLGLVPH